MASKEQNIGAIVILTPPKKGDNVWTAVQIDVVHNLPPGGIHGREEISWSFGPIKVTGYVDTNTYEIGVSVTIAGINVGNVWGNLHDGVVLKVDLLIATGEIRFYLKNGNELWVHLDVKITFDGHYGGDYKIMTI